MLIRNITYENLDEEMVTEKFHFHLTRVEIIEMQFDHPGGMQGALERMVNAQDIKSIMAEMKKIILGSYGKRSDDGKRFMKNDDIRTEFIETGAYDSLFMELVTSDEAAASFIKAVIPKSFMEAIAKAEIENVKADVMMPPPAKE